LLQGVAAQPEDEPQELSELYRRALELIRGDFEARTWRAFWMVAVDGVPTAEAAGELGLSTASVRQAKSRVLRRLKDELGEFIA
jgi:RNA polymerase sigma-70 factor (ECF subfamily)